MTATTTTEYRGIDHGDTAAIYESNTTYCTYQDKRAWPLIDSNDDSSIHLEMLHVANIDCSLVRKLCHVTSKIPSRIISITFLP